MSKSRIDRKAATKPPIWAARPVFFGLTCGQSFGPPIKPDGNVSPYRRQNEQATAISAANPETGTPHHAGSDQPRTRSRYQARSSRADRGRKDAGDSDAQRYKPGKYRKRRNERLNAACREQGRECPQHDEQKVRAR